MDAKTVCPRCKAVETKGFYCHKCEPAIYRESQKVVYGEAPKPAND